jgi:hypothetical protein
MFFAYGSGEHDTFMMAAGITHGVKTNAPINSMNYGNDLQFLFYYCMHYLARMYNIEGVSVLLMMNIFGSLMALLVPVLLFVLLTRMETRFSLGVAIILLLTSPTYALIVPYGHPFHLAFVLSLISFLIFQRIGGKPWKASFLFGLAVVLQGIALAIRTEQVFLFWFCVFGLLLYKREQRTAQWVLLLLMLASATALFLALHGLLVPRADNLSQSSSELRSYLSVFARFYHILEVMYHNSDLRRSLAYHVTDIGLPLLMTTAVLVTQQISQRKYYMIGALFVSAGPSFLTYVVNTSPPRHFIITIIALALYVGASVRNIEPKKLLPLALFCLALNTSLPWLFGVADSAGYRRNYTYSFFERSYRNREQTNAAFTVFTAILSKGPVEITLFGQWVHIAQFCLLIASDPSVSFQKTELAPGVPASLIIYQGRRVYLVETYDANTVQGILRVARRVGHMAFLSLIPGTTINDFHIVLPPQLSWWSV